MKYRCPCCGYYTFYEKPEGTYSICEVCFWEDEGISDAYAMDVCGTNHVSCLNEARENFVKYGACEKEMVKYTRKPKKEELQGIDTFSKEFWEKRR